MTATNHIITGALIAVTVHNPWLALPLALLSHFIMDLLPQYGLSYIPEHERDQNGFFRRFVAVDTVLALALFLSLPYVLRNHVNLAVSAWCMFLAQAPDTVWFYRHMYAVRSGTYKPSGWFARFHKAIQWCERSWGIYFELCWLTVSSITIRLVI